MKIMQVMITTHAFELSIIKLQENDNLGIHGIFKSLQSAVQWESARTIGEYSGKGSSLKIFISQPKTQNSLPSTP